MWQHLKLSEVSLGTLPQYSLVVDGDIEKSNKQTNRTFYPSPLQIWFDLSLLNYSIPRGVVEGGICVPQDLHTF